MIKSALILNKHPIMLVCKINHLDQRRASFACMSVVIAPGLNLASSVPGDSEASLVLPCVVLSHLLLVNDPA
jgi:hypothetical protein